MTIKSEIERKAAMEEYQALSKKLDYTRIDATMRPVLKRRTEKVYNRLKEHAINQAVTELDRQLRIRRG